MNDKIEAAKRAYEEARSQLDNAVRKIEELPEDAEAETLDAIQAEFDTAEEEVKSRKRRLEELERVARAREEHPPLLPSREESEGDGDGDAAVRNHPQPKGGKRAEHTYRPDAPHSFFRDLYTAKVQGDREAQERLAQHQKETRDVTTADPGAGVFVPPVYLGEMWADLPRESRPFAAALPTMPLPDVGMSVTVPRITTGTTTAVQAAENDAVSETDIDGTLLTVNVRTIAGQNDVSRQALERTFPGMDFLIFQDLRADYDEQLDTQVISGSGASGQHLGVNAVTGINTVAYTDASPTAAELVPKIYDGIQQIASGRFKRPDLIVMHPRRAAWLASNLSSTFPLFQLGSYVQAAGSQDGGFVQNFAGLQVIQDANISTEIGASTDEDEILIVRSADLFLMEGPLRAMVYEQTLSGTLQVRLQVFAYSAFISGRQPEAIARIRGTGLKAPTF